MRRVLRRRMTRSRRGTSAACVGIGARFGAKIAMCELADLIAIVFMKIRDVVPSFRGAFFQPVYYSRGLFDHPVDFNDCMNITETVH